MEWTQTITLILTNIGFVTALFLWNRSESNADRKEFRRENNELRKDLIDAIRSIDKEMKDFHGRLCDLEARRK